MAAADLVASIFGDKHPGTAVELEALQAENLYLRQLVGELLLKNQRLRDASLRESMAIEPPLASASRGSG